jgi:hypothetical protein
MIEPLITFTEAARFVGINRRRINALLARERITVHRDPLDARRKLVRRSDLERLRTLSVGAPRSTKREVANAA